MKKADFFSPIIYLHKDFFRKCFSKIVQKKNVK